MTGFPSPLTTATLLLLSVAAMTTRANADFLVESDGGLAVKISTVRQGNTTPCDYCFNSGVALSPDCIAQSDIVKSIISRDSSCGRMWDPFCIVEYNDCYNEACGADQQGVIDTIAATGGPVGAPINREQIRAKCAGIDGRVDTPPSPPPKNYYFKLSARVDLQRPPPMAARRAARRAGPVWGRRGARKAAISVAAKRGARKAAIMLAARRAERRANTRQRHPQRHPVMITITGRGGGSTRQLSSPHSLILILNI